MTHIIAKSGLAQVQIKGQLVSAKQKFKVTQTSDGDALVFSIGEDGHLYSIQESHSNNHQWAHHNLTKQIMPKVEVIDFAFFHDSDTIDLVLAVKCEGKHKVYSSFNNNSSTDFSTITWKEIIYDDVYEGKPRFNSLQISQVDILTIEGYQVISVLVNDEQRHFRYFLDLEQDQIWSPRQLALDYENIQHLRYCIGVNTIESIPGTYILGKQIDSSIILFSPLYDKYEPTLNPPSASLKLEQFSIDAMASVFTDSANTELFIAGEGKLFYYRSNEQIGQTASAPRKLFEHHLFHQIKHLEVMVEDSSYVVWGLNEQGAIFYTTCPLGKQEQDGAWSNPVIIQRHVNRLSSFYNHTTQELSYFSHDEYGHLIHAVRCPRTRLWTQNPVMVPASNQSTLELHNGYKSTLLVVGEDGEALPNEEIWIRTKHQTTARVLVNKIPTRINREGITFQTDHRGCIEIEEIVNGLEATEFEAYKNEQSEITLINPMNASMDKINQIHTHEAMEQLGWGKGKTPKEKDEILSVLGKAGESYVEMLKGNSTDRDQDQFVVHGAAFHGGTLMLSATDQTVHLEWDTGWLDWVEEAVNKVVSTVGDVINHAKEWIKDGLQAVVVFAKGAWRLVTKIGNEIFHAVLDTVKSVLGAVTTIVKKIAKDVKDIWDKLCNISKGVDAYVYCADDASVEVTIAGKSQTFSSGYHTFSHDVGIKDMFSESIKLETLGKTFSGVIDPITGILFSSDFGHLLKTRSLFVGNHVISYGFYDAGPGYVGLPNRDQVYIYVGKNQSNWLGGLIAKYPDQNIQIKDLVLAGSHDSGMYVDIPTSASLAGRALIFGMGALASATIPVLGSIVGFILGAAALVYSPKRISRNASLTQKESIKEQLKLGVRYFDFRPGYNILSGGNKALEIFTKVAGNISKNTSAEEIKNIGKTVNDELKKLDYKLMDICHLHAIIPGAKLSDAIADCVEFLKEHPDEIVVMSLMYNGIISDKLIASYDVLDSIVDQELKYGIQKVNILRDRKKGNSKLRQDYNTWAKFSEADVKTLIKDNKRLIIAYEIEKGQGEYFDDTEKKWKGEKEYESYSSYTNCYADPQAMIYGIETKRKGGRSIGMLDVIKETKEDTLGILAMQATMLELMMNNIKGISRDVKKGDEQFSVKQAGAFLMALSSFSNASSFVLSTKGLIDKVVYPWVKRTLVDDAQGKGTIAICNDFVDIGLASIAVDATQKRLEHKSQKEG